VYHERETAEQTSLLDRIETSAQTDPHRREVFHMAKSIAQSYIEQGEQREAVRARQQTLIRLLGKKFRKVPDAVVKRIEATSDVELLDAWLDNVVTARKLTDVRITPAE
jgi:hypothetical protein